MADRAHGFIITIICRLHLLPEDRWAVDRVPALAVRVWADDPAAHRVPAAHLAAAAALAAVRAEAVLAEAPAGEALAAAHAAAALVAARAAEASEEALAAAVALAVAADNDHRKSGEKQCFSPDFCV